MTAIERTAYPRFKSLPNLKELAELYTPTESELAFARVQTASKEGRFRLLISLKAFQRLGYFPDAASIPTALIEHLRKLLNLTHIPLVMEREKQLRNRCGEQIIALAGRRKEL